ncbi:hypothetical protein E4T52_08279 [Aureobasidium sp. EXF-3400]|nr:hypothetical protein E4T51_11566 [Aureobasidium sp. EXF-12344]KAI4776783.1 hypothetical protein E4T52_08279 [Aureobasidium sp. EXF-3400]
MIEVVARLLQHGCDLSVDPDLLSVVHVKLARRAFKYEQAYGESGNSSAQKVSGTARKTLQQTWSRHVKGYDAIEQLPVTGWVDDTSLSLPPGTRQALSQAIAPLAPSKQLSAIALQSPPRIVQDPSKLPSLGSAVTAKYLLTALIDVELWTVLQLASGGTSACASLAALIEDYWKFASSEYSCSPLEKSGALLVVTELWIALDKICTGDIPLLLEYSLEISASTFDCLLLPKLEQMHRLTAVETYINTRHLQASRPTVGVFAKPARYSFCSRYYEQTDSLQQLRKSID